MDIFAFPPLTLLLDGAYRALIQLVALLEPLAGPTAAALAVIVVTMLVRALGIMNGLHYLTAVFAVFVPLTAALYLVVTVTWTLAQRTLLRRRYPLPA